MHYTRCFLATAYKGRAQLQAQSKDSSHNWAFGTMPVAIATFILNFERHAKHRNPLKAKQKVLGLKSGDK
jgi:hypothetical protein